MYGTSVEHHALYQYQFEGTRDVVLGQAQTETAYWQPAPHPFSRAVEEGWNDPDVARNGGSGWGMRVVESEGVAVYGAGLYSFFDGYNNCGFPPPPPRSFFFFLGSAAEADVGEIACSFQVNGNCQKSIFSIEGSASKNVNVYNLNTVGAVSMVDRDGKSLARGEDNLSVFPNGIAVFRSN